MKVSVYKYIWESWIKNHQGLAIVDDEDLPKLNSDEVEQVNIFTDAELTKLIEDAERRAFEAGMSYIECVDGERTVMAEAWADYQQRKKGE